MPCPGCPLCSPGHAHSPFLMSRWHGWPKGRAKAPRPDPGPPEEITLEPEPEPEPPADAPGIARAAKPRGSLEDAIRAAQDCVPCRAALDPPAPAE